jgi:multiple sugar transport system substrate-binding protein
MVAARRLRRFFLTAAGIFALLWVAGCAGEVGNSSETASGLSKAAESGPITLQLYQHSANISDEEFQRLMVEPVKKKFPNITMQLTRSSNTSPEKLISSGDVPDLIFGSQLSIQVFKDLRLPLDLTDPLKQNRIDPGKFDQTAINVIRTFSEDGRMFALPFAVNFAVLYYNKDIFDKFATAYPKSGMRWEEAIELARKLTRSSDGTQFQGLNINGGVTKPGSQMSLPLVDPKKNKAAILTDGWKRAFEIMKAADDIPGNTTKATPKDAFLKDRTLAMLAAAGARIGEIEEMYKADNAMNWNIASYPSFTEAPGKGIGVDIHLLMVTATGKHLKEALGVLDLLTSDQAQLDMNKGGRLSSLKDMKIRQSFGSNLVSLKGVDLQPIFNYQAADILSFSPYDGLVTKQLDSAMKDVTGGKNDINTALRNAEDAANKAIAAELEGNK